MAAVVALDRFADPVARKSNEVLADLSPEIIWHQSHVSDERLFCEYTAPSAELIREPARQGGFPAVGSARS